MTLALVLFAACSAKPSTPPEAPAPEAPAATPEPVVEDPKSLYAACEDRVEQPQTAGECTTDADCKAMGCSSEVCAAAQSGPMMTTCEVQPCFAVLSSCGCHEGVCTWTLADAAE